MFIHICIYFHNSFVIFMQVTQQIYVAKEWVRNTHDEVKAEAHSLLEVKKAPGALRVEQARLLEKLKEAI